MSAVRRILLVVALALVAGLVSMSVAAAKPSPPPAASPDTATVTVTARVAGPHAKQTSPPTKTWVISPDDPVSLIGVADPIGILAQYACDSGTLSAYGSGDVARWKICPERDSNNYKWRGHAAVWCDHGTTPVNCSIIYGAAVKGNLRKNGTLVGTVGPNFFSNATNTHSKAFDIPWQCYGTSLGQFYAYYNNLQARSRYNEAGTAKTFSSGLTPYMGGCNGALA